MTHPTAITLDKAAGNLHIEWSDGMVCDYPLSQLREACPCVECRGGHHNMGMANAPKDILTLTPARSYKIEQIESIGNYAIQPTWDDGHHTGIYTFGYLYHLCPQREEVHGD
jgi:DUF971 family protein